MTAIRSLFVTGASGFVGRRVLARIDPERLERVVLLTRTELWLPERLASSPRVEQIRSGLHRPERYAGAIDAETAILHLAARTGRGRPAQFERDNVEGTRDLVTAAEEQEAAGLVNVSAIAAKLPPEMHYPLAASKRTAEAIVAKGLVPWVTIRPTTVLGPGAPVWRELRRIARSPVMVIPGPPSTRIQPIHVDDLAAVLLEVALEGPFDRKVHEIGGAEVITIEELLKRVHRKLTGRRGVVAAAPVGPGVPLLRAFERISPVPLPVTEGQLAPFLHDGVAEGDGLRDRLAGRLRGVDEILATLD